MKINFSTLLTSAITLLSSIPALLAKPQELLCYYFNLAETAQAYVADEGMYFLLKTDKDYPVWELLKQKLMSDICGYFTDLSNQTLNFDLKLDHQIGSGGVCEEGRKSQFATALFMDNLNYHLHRDTSCINLVMEQVITENNPNDEGSGHKAIYVYITAIFIISLIIGTSCAFYFRKRNQSNLQERNEAASDMPEPGHFKCPITLELMKNPYVDPSGVSLEKGALLAWLVTNKTSPISRAPLTEDKLIPNHVLKKVIEDYKKKVGIDLPQTQVTTSPPPRWYHHFFTFWKKPTQEQEIELLSVAQRRMDNLT